MESIWSKTAALPSYEPLPGDLEADAAVIGGGMAGLLTAYYLTKKGYRTVVLEAETICSGQTRNTTAKITSQHGLIYHKLRDTLGDDAAIRYARMNERAIGEYKKLVKELAMDCDFEEKPAFLYSVTEAEPLKREAEAAHQAGIHAAFLTETELPFPVKGAVRFEGQAQFHPLQFLSAVLPSLTIYEHTPVKDVEGERIVTGRGTVRAKHIVFAAHYPFLNAPGYYFVRMHQERSYVIALKKAAKLQGMYLGIDRENGWSLRNYGEYLLFGGGTHRTGENRSGGKYRSLRQKAEELWPQSIEEAHWSAQDCMTLDGVPYIGRYSSSTPNWYVATGFQKWGMTSSMAAALIIPELIEGKEVPDSEVFSPLRVTPGASAKTLLDEGRHAVRDLSRRIFAPARADISQLPDGHGGVVDCDGEKVGVYKDDKGEAYFVSVKCPHLGCQLEWNPDEKSWDCPCHGSRFDYKGNLIDNPAQEGLSHDV